MDAVRENLRRAFEGGRPAQAYLIVGPVRQEGQELAEWIGTQLLGDTPSISAHTHPDMPWFAPEKKSRLIDVEMMTERILPFAQQSALSGGWKVCVIASVDRFNDSSANAFLKTLEEPPPKTLFLLLADSLADILPTIISRCQVLNAGGTRKLEEPWLSEALAILSGVDEKSALLDTVRADQFCEIINDMRSRAEKDVKAEKKAEEGLELDKEYYDALVEAKTKAWRADLLLVIEHWMQDLVRIKASGDSATLTFEPYRTTLAQRAAHYSLAKLLENQTNLESFAEQLDRYIKPEQVLPYWMDRFFL